MNPNSVAHPESRPEGLPTPATLAEVMLSSRQMLIEQAAESLHVSYLVFIFLVSFTAPCPTK